MTQKGEHTWDLVLQYHRCPNCGKIIESREDFHYRSGKYLKDVECPECKHKFALEKFARTGPAPLFGDPQPPEWEWKS